MLAYHSLLSLSKLEGTWKTGPAGVCINNHNLLIQWNLNTYPGPYLDKPPLEWGMS